MPFFRGTVPPTTSGFGKRLLVDITFFVLSQVHNGYNGYRAVARRLHVVPWMCAGNAIIIFTTLEQFNPVPSSFVTWNYMHACSQWVHSLSLSLPPSLSAPYPKGKEKETRATFTATNLKMASTPAAHPRKGQDYSTQQHGQRHYHTPSLQK